MNTGAAIDSGGESGPDDPAGSGGRSAAKRADVRRLVLVGFMAAGKSTIAPLLARALGWRVLDVDAEIVARTGKTVGNLFRENGESAFRAMESELTAALSSEGSVVVAPGGGWIAGPGSRAIRDDPGTRLVWLRISIDEAVRRAALDDTERPMLTGHAVDITADRGSAEVLPTENARRLLAEREPLYATAHLTIDVDGKTADAVVDDILSWLKTNIS